MILQICEKIPQVNLTKIKEWPENNLPKFEKFFKNTYTVTSPSTAYSTPRLLCHTYTNIDIHTPVISEVTNIKKSRKTGVNFTKLFEGRTRFDFPNFCIWIWKRNSMCIRMKDNIY